MKRRRAQSDVQQVFFDPLDSWLNREIMIANSSEFQRSLSSSGINLAFALLKHAQLRYDAAAEHLNMQCPAA